MAQELIMDRNTESAINTARILYIVHALTLVFSLGTLSIIPTLINYVKRGETAGTVAHSHHTWMIRSFWYFVLWMAMGWLIMFTLGWILIGFPLAWGIWIIAVLWKAYRLIRGFLDLNENRPMPV